MNKYINTGDIEKFMNREEWGTPDEKWWPEREIGLVIDAIPTADVVDRNECSKCVLYPFKQLREQQWIPCGERLPKTSGRYLVTRGLNACGSLWNRVYIANYSDLMGLKSERIWWNGNVGKSDFERIDDVLAWMPLPQPWEGEK